MSNFFVVFKLSNVQFPNNVDDNFLNCCNTIHSKVMSQSFHCCCDPLYIVVMKRVEDKAGIVEQINSLFFVLTEV